MSAPPRSGTPLDPMDLILAHSGSGIVAGRTLGQKDPYDPPTLPTRYGPENHG